MKRIEDLPQRSQSLIRRLIEKGCIEEHNGKVDITDEMAKLLLILDMADVFN